MRDLVQRLYVVVGLPRLHPRQYQTLFNALALTRVDKGDELRIAGVDREARTVTLEGADGHSKVFRSRRSADND